MGQMKEKLQIGCKQFSSFTLAQIFVQENFAKIKKKTRIIKFTNLIILF
jgi:hypothetical protein